MFLGIDKSNQGYIEIKKNKNVGLKANANLQVQSIDKNFKMRTIIIKIC